MRIAVCSHDMKERYTLSKQLEAALLRRDIFPKIFLLPMPQYVIAAAIMEIPLDLVVIAGNANTPAIKELCCHVPVIIVGNKEEGPAAFDVGAAYFLEIPVDTTKLEKALNRCLNGKRRK